MRFSIALSLGLAFAACGGANSGHARPAEDRGTTRPQPEMRAVEGVDEDTAGVAETYVEGVVRIVGNDPSPQIVLSVGEGASAYQIALVGDLRNELGRLSGVAVVVFGDSVANPQGLPVRAIDVQDYDVLSVNSEPAYLGVLENREGVWWLEREEPLRLVALPADLEDRDGAKVWIVGPLAGDELRVQSYGLVRDR